MNSIWVRYCPAFVRRHLEGRHNLQEILANIGWLFGDQILRMGVGLLVGVWVARYLGPEQFGMLNYAMAFVALFGSVASLGLNGIVVRDIVKEPETANTTLGTAFLLQIFGGLLAFGLAVFAISFARPNDNLAKLMVAILGFVMVFKATEVVKYWFESQIKSKYIVWVENGSFLILAAVKVGLILFQASLIAFVWAAFAEGLLVAMGLLIVYFWRDGTMSAWRICYSRAKNLLKDSWPLILSGLAIMVYMRIDQIMLGQMLGDEAVGIYSAAARISEVWYFIPMAIVASVFPSIIEAKKQSEILYYQRLQQLYDLMVFLALAVAIPITFLSDWLITLIFGSSYSEAGRVLAIHVWTGVFVFLGVASSKWFLTENLQKLACYRTLLGALMNIGANLILIPKFGVTGAAWATLASQITVTYASDALNIKTRNLFWMKTKAFLLFKHNRLGSL
ncbi:MAG: flippase [Deltaproteobacteria bacterium]|nr:flippase [Deltaproteobacteria bacterium]